MTDTDDSFGYLAIREINMLLYEKKTQREEGTMDEMRLKLSTNFMRKMVSKMISRFIYKKLGYKVNIQLQDLDIWVIDGDTNIKLNVEASLKSDEFNKITKSIEND